MAVKDKQQQDDDRKFQAVVLLDVPHGSHHFDAITISKEHPSHPSLLPICNRPILDYTLEWLCTGAAAGALSLQPGSSSYGSRSAASGSLTYLHEIFLIGSRRTCQILKMYLKSHPKWQSLLVVSSDSEPFSYDDRDTFDIHHQPVSKNRGSNGTFINVSASWASNPLSPKIHLIVQPPSVSTTGDIMRELDSLSLIHTDFLLLTSPDIISNISVHQLWNSHVSKRANNKKLIMTSVMNRIDPMNQAKDRVSQDDDNLVNCVFVVDKNSGDIKSLMNYGDSIYDLCSFLHDKSTNEPTRNAMARRGNEDSSNSLVTVSLDFLKKSAFHLQARKDLETTGLYVCSLEVLALFTENFDYQSIWTDLYQGISCSDILSFEFHALIVDELSDSHLTGSHASLFSTSKAVPIHSKNFLACGASKTPFKYYHSTMSLLSRRIYPFLPEYWGQYTFDLHKNLYKAKNVQIDNEDTMMKTIGMSRIMIGNDSCVGEKVYMKGLVIIGDNVEIKGNVSLTNVIVGNGCFIEKDCVLEDVIVGENCIIGEGVKLCHGAIIGPKVQLTKSQQILQEEKRFISIVSAKHVLGSAWSELTHSHGYYDKIQAETKNSLAIPIGNLAGISKQNGNVLFMCGTSPTGSSLEMDYIDDGNMSSEGTSYCGSESASDRGIRSLLGALQVCEDLIEWNEHNSRPVKKMIEKASRRISCYRDDDDGSDDDDEDEMSLAEDEDDPNREISYYKLRKLASFFPSLFNATYLNDYYQVLAYFQVDLPYLAPPLDAKAVGTLRTSATMLESNFGSNKDVRKKSDCNKEQFYGEASETILHALLSVGKDKLASSTSVKGNSNRIIENTALELNALKLSCNVTTMDIRLTVISVLVHALLFSIRGDSPSASTGGKSSKADSKSIVPQTNVQIQSQVTQIFGVWSPLIKKFISSGGKDDSVSIDCETQILDLLMLSLHDSYQRTRPSLPFTPGLAALFAHSVQLGSSPGMTSPSLNHNNSTQGLGTFSLQTVVSLFPRIITTLYQNDVIDEESIIKWYNVKDPVSGSLARTPSPINTANVTVSIVKMIKESSSGFVNWLQQDDDEDDDSDASTSSNESASSMHFDSDNEDENDL